MNAALRLAGFAGVVAVLAGGAALAGAAIDPSAPGGDHAAARGHQTGSHGAAPDNVRGLGVAENGLRIVVEDGELRRGAAERLRFRIVDDAGQAVRDFDVEHTKRMHLIVARRDLTGFQHLHPRLSADGTWSTGLKLAEAGSYRVFADFSHEGRATTLAADVHVDGRAAFEALPAPAAKARSDGGYDVELDAGNPHAGREAVLRFSVSKDGRPVDVEPYLGAGGHLVALRDGDLAFLHVHPIEDGREIAFGARFPTAARYRLFLQFQHEGRVQTVAFTQEVE